MLKTAMANLTDRERHILTQRRLTEEPMTLEELSQIYKISRERVRQIEVRAFEKVQEMINKQATPGTNNATPPRESADVT